jgi:hypothetical protein
MTRRITAIAVSGVLLPRMAAACPVCFGANDGPILQGSNMGILALLVVTLAVLGAFGGFFITLARRAARALPETPAAFEAGSHPKVGAR